MKKSNLNSKSFVFLIFCLALITLGCSKDNSGSQESTQSQQESALMKTKRTTQISGVSFIAEANECDYQSQGANYALRMTGDLEGCFYIFIDAFKCSGDGIYFEKGRELFVGTYKGKSGTFRTTYKFEAKYEGCAENGSYLGAEIIGLCQHPIVEGSGEGVFEGVTGRLDIWDNVEAGRYPYIGHLRF